MVAARAQCIFIKLLYQVYLYTSLGCGVASDILVASSLCVGLSKSRTGFKRLVNFIISAPSLNSVAPHRTDGLIHLLMAYAINTSESHAQ
jgi:hypothetical protein